MIWIYCKTTDDPKEVGEFICRSVFEQNNSEPKSRVIKDDSEDDCWIIKTNRQDETSAIIYQIGQEIVAIEVDDSCASNVIEPLMKKHGFENIKWLSTK